MKMSELLLTDSLRSKFYRKNNFEFLSILIWKLWDLEVGEISKFDKLSGEKNSSVD